MSVKSVRNAFAILRHMAGRDPQGVNAIARAVGLSPSSCFNLLRTLVAEGLLSFDGKTKKYALEPLPARMFTVEPEMAAWTEWLLAQLRRIADKHLLSCGLWQIRGDRLVLRQVVESPNPTRVYLSLGQRLPIHIGAMGRCVAASQNLTRDEVTAVVGRLRWQTAPTADAFMRDMEHARTRGWAVDHSHYMRGLTSIAAPITDSAGRVQQALSGTAFAGQHDDSEIEAIGTDMAGLAQAARQRLSRLLEGVT